MSNILLDAVARLQPEMPQFLAMHSALNHVAKLFANMLKIRLPDANTNRMREANIFQFDFHLHLEFFLHKNYFRLAVIYRILLRRNASCHTSTATVAATFVSLTAMQSLHQFIDQLAEVRSVCESVCVCVCARGLLNKWTDLCPIWALAHSLQMSDAPSFKANIKFAAHPSRKSNRQRIKLKSHESNQIFNSKPIKTTL